MLGLILFGLWLLNRYLELDRYVRAPLPVLREVWLPLLFLLFYTLFGLAWVLWRTIGVEQVGSEFPDIDPAWDEAMAAMGEAALDLSEAPLFLVLGRPVGGERALFGAGNVKLQVKQAPRRPDTPLTVSANQDAVYVTLRGGLAARPVRDPARPAPRRLGPPGTAPPATRGVGRRPSAGRAATGARRRTATRRRP